MITRKELLRGTLKDLEDYFYNTIGIIKKVDIDIPIKDCLMEISNEQTIHKQLKNISLKDKPISPVAYLDFKFNEKNKHPTATIKVESIWVYIVDEKEEELMMNMYKNKE
jgi:hypothetical protein